MSSSNPENNPNKGVGPAGGPSSSSSLPPNQQFIHSDPLTPLFQPFSAAELAADDDFNPHFPCFPSFLDSHSSSFPFLPSLDQFGPFPSSLYHHSAPQASTSTVVLATPFSAVPPPSFSNTATPSRADGGEGALKSPPPSCEADHQPARPMTVTPPPPPPQPSPNEAAAATTSAGVTTGVPSAKRKRGRPRKNFPEASSAVAGQGRREPLEAIPPPQQATPSSKRKKKEQGQASRSKRKNKDSSSRVKLDRPSTTLGLASKRNIYEPAIIIVKEGEDVSEKMISFTRDNGAVFISTACGVLSYVELLEPSESAVTRFEGKFNILMLSGTLLLNRDGQSRSGQLTISMTQLDGRVIGGNVHGRLIAASPIQIVGGIIVPANKGASKPSVSDRKIGLNKRISSMRQEWQAQLDELKRDAQEAKREAQEANQRFETTKKELEEIRQHLSEMRQQPSENRQ